MSYNGFYLVGNYPDKQTFINAALEGLSYFDFLEVGLPFSDPIADGPVLAKASHKALANGVTTSDVLDSISVITQHLRTTSINKHIYIMTYANKVFHNGIDIAFEHFAQSGVHGVILADVPFVESYRFINSAIKAGLTYIHFITPESTKEDIATICSAASGFVYAISMRGTTGSTLTLDNEVKEKLHYAKKLARVPVVLGFGVQSHNDVVQILQVADGFIVGTALVQALEKDFDYFKDALRNFFNT